MLRAFVIAVCLLASIGGCADAAVWRVPLRRHLAATQAARRALQSLPLSGSSSARNANSHSSVWTPSFPSPNATDEVRFALSQGKGPDGCEIFAGEVLIGTPPQPVSLGISLVSGDVIVLNHKLDGHAFYNHSASTTYIANGTRVSFAQTDGFLSRDHVDVGLMQVKNQFVAELAGPDEKLEAFPVNYDGAIGLGPTSALQNAGTPSLVRSMISQNLLDSPEAANTEHMENRTHVLWRWF